MIKPTWLPPEVLDEYHLVRLLGRGSMGYVYLAQDTLLERPVAVKLIAQRRPDESAKQRFLAEARALARLQHPNVVTIHRAGEVQGYPYLVTELVRGQSLSELPKPISNEQVISIGLDLARGLAAAHRSGVLHRDIKPANAIIADSGEAKLIDFGVAVMMRETAAPSNRGPAPFSDPGQVEIVGTQMYMAPEALHFEPATVRSDIYALGAVLYELCTGVAPRSTLPPDAGDEAWVAGIPDPIELRAPDIDPRLASVIMRCLAPSPDDRFLSADTLADALAVIPVGSTLPAPPGNPYRGLASFEAEHRALFFGRAAESRTVIDRLRQTAVAVVAGDSGVGKSSLCRAGVVPLVLEGALGDGRRYRHVTVLPGKHPYASLLTAVGATFPIDEAAIAQEERYDPAAFARALRRALGKTDGALLVVDQAEELVTFADPAEAQAFAAIVAQLPAAAAGVRVLLAVRGDFFTRLAALPGVGDVLDRSLFVLRPLSPEGVRSAITGPVAQHGVSFDPPDLVDVLTSAAVETAGGLPLLQFALAELWESKGDAKTITPALLDAIGGVGGALARHADAVMGGLSPEARAAARRILLSLVTPDATGRRRIAGELGIDTPAAQTALDALVAGRLIVAREAEGNAVYELAHESLLKSWAQLARWLDESHEERRLIEELDEAAAFWVRRGRRIEETWSEQELLTARRRVAQLGISLPPRIETFLAEGERRHATLRRRARGRMAIGAVVAAVLTIASLVAAGEFRQQKIEAERQAEALRRQADALRLAAGNLGRIELVLRPFDWRDGARIPVTLSELPNVAWRLYGPKPNDRNHPGARISADLVRVSPVHGAVPTERIEHVEAPGGLTFLHIDGRGRAGETCASSWIRLQSLPGYAVRFGTIPRIEIDVPTCQASAADMVEVPAGPFIYGGAGDPPTRFEAYLEPERTVDLHAYAIDRMEVSNAAFRPFALLAQLSGYPAPKYSTMGTLKQSGAPEMPVTSLDAVTAEAFCRFMGKRLPSDFEWTKAARGGLTVGGKPNPNPRRLFPWGVAPDDRCVTSNAQEGDSQWVTSVASNACGASPYGGLNFAGNVAEWISREGQTDQDNVLRVVRGGAINSPRELEHTTTVFRNAREGRYFDFTIGVRCVAGGRTERTDLWNEQ